jgi:hypothetical protein
LQVAPLTKLVPVTIALLTVAPCAPLLGFTADTPGGFATTAVTENPLVNVPTCASGLVTVTLRFPTVAPATMVRLAVILVLEVNAHEVTVMPAPKLHVAPLTKFVPLTATPLTDAPCAALFGLTEVTVGAGSAAGFTVKPFVNVAVCPSVFFTVTVRAPVVAAAAIVMLAVTFVAELNVHVFTVMPAPKLQTGPLRKFVPVSTTLPSVAPCIPLFGLAEVNVGAGALATVIMRVAGLGSVCPAASVTVKTAVYVPAVAKVTAPGFASALLAGEAPRNDHEYAEIVPVPVPANVTDCPGAIKMSEAGLVIVPFGAVSVGVKDTCTNFATDGTPALFSKKIM